MGQSPIHPADVLPALDELFGAIDRYRTSHGFLELLKFLSELPSVGPYNGLLLHIQRPGVTHVATASGWRALGRMVKREAAPLVTLRPFGPVEFVYDILDTTGPELPQDVSDPFRARGRLPPGVLERTALHTESDGIAVLEAGFGGSLAGRVSGQRVAHEIVRLSSGESAALVVELNSRHAREARYATLVHELAHVYSGHLGTQSGAWWPDRSRLDTMRREFEAEAVTQIVCSRQGLDPGSYRYLEGYLRGQPNAPDISLNQMMVAANHIELLGTKRFRAKDTEGHRRGGDMSGVLSINTGKPISKEDDRLNEEIAEAIIARIAKEEQQE